MAFAHRADIPMVSASTISNPITVVRYKLSGLHAMLGPCTVAIALLTEVPHIFTPEAPTTPSGQSATVFKNSFSLASNHLLQCMEPPHGTNAGWVEVSK